MGKLGLSSYGLALDEKKKENVWSSRNGLTSLVSGTYDKQGCKTFYGDSTKVGCTKGDIPKLFIIANLT